MRSRLRPRPRPTSRRYSIATSMPSTPTCSGGSAGPRRRAFRRDLSDRLRQAGSVRRLATRRPALALRHRDQSPPPPPPPRAAPAAGLREERRRPGPRRLRRGRGAGRCLQRSARAGRRTDPVSRPRSSTHSCSLPGPISPTRRSPRRSRIPIGTVRSRLSRARARMRAALELEPPRPSPSQSATREVTDERDRAPQ